MYGVFDLSTDQLRAFTSWTEVSVCSVWLYSFRSCVSWKIGNWCCTSCCVWTLILISFLISWLWIFLSRSYRLMTFLQWQGTTMKLLGKIVFLCSKWWVFEFSVLDQIHLMAYDYHGSWETYTGLNAPLYANPKVESGSNLLLNVVSNLAVFCANLLRIEPRLMYC